MMTIRVKTGQNDLDVCIAALRFAFDTGVSEMRTKWFSIDPDCGLRWKNIDFGISVLDRVKEELLLQLKRGAKGKASYEDYPPCFANYIGVFTA